MINTSDPFGGATAVRGGQSAAASKNNVLSSVNLYRGNLGFSFTAAYLDGRDGLSASVQINYAPNREDAFLSKNLECGSSVVGYHWTMPLMSIAVRSRTLRETYNADYFLVSEGGEYPLYQTNKSGNCVNFYSVEHPLWKIRLVNAAAPYWEIVRENGQIYTYGGTDDSLEVNVAWNNFTGASDSKGGQVFPVGWYVSKIETPKGGILTFAYENIKTQLGGAKFTSELHLKSVISSYRQRINLYYALKEPDEYALPNLPQKGKLYYQSLNESHYLDYAEIVNENAVVLYRQKFEYSLVPAAKGERKRLLTSVTQVLPSGEAMPSQTFEYDLQTGWLVKQTMPQSGSITYGYEPQTLMKYAPSAAVEVSSGAEVSTAAGADFLVVASLIGMRLKVGIYAFASKWKAFTDDFFDGISADRPKIYTGAGLVALLYFKPNRNDYSLRLYKRSPVKRFDWEVSEYDLGEAELPAIACGAGFVAIQYSARRELCVWQYNYTNRSWDLHSLPVDPQQNRSLCAGNNCIFGAYSQGAGGVRLMSFYADEDHNWQQGNYLDVPADVNWQYADTLPQLAVNSAIGSAAFFSFNQNTGVTTATLIAFSWDVAYALTEYRIFEITQSGYIQNPIYYTIASDTIIGFANTAYRYTPDGWVKCELLTPSQNCEYVYGYGSDLFLGAEYDSGRVTYYAARFDPYENAWTTDDVPVCKALEADQITPPLVSGSYALLGNSVFLRDGNGSWNLLDILPREADLSSARLNSIGGAYLIYNVTKRRTLRFTPLSRAGFAKSIDFEGEALDPKISYGACIGCFISSGMDGALNLRKLKDNCYAEQYTQSAVTSVCYDEGRSRRTFYIEYDNAKARIDGEAMAMTGVALIPEDLGAPLGRTVYNYFNGSAPDDFQYPDDPATNVKDFYSRFGGRLFSAAVYDADGSQISENITYSRALDAAGFHIAQSRNIKREFVKGFDWASGKSGSELLPLEAVIDNEYDEACFTLKKSVKTAYDKAGRPVATSRTFRRACEDYPGLAGLNLLEQYSGSVSRDENSGAVIGAERFVWSQNSRGRWYQSASQSWNGTGEPDFENGANWIPDCAVMQVDDYCNELCSCDRLGVFRATIYDRVGNIIIAEIEDCKPDEVLYCGFEDYENLSSVSLSSGAICESVTVSECYSGTQSLRIKGGEIFSAFVGRITREGVLVHFAIKASAEVKLCSGGFVKTLGADVLAFGEWSEVSENIADSAAENKITLASEADFYLDTVFITPLTAKGTASVFSGDFLNVCAKHDNTGGGSRVFSDRTHKSVADADCFGNFTGLSDTFQDKVRGMSEIFTVKAVSNGALYTAQQGYITNALIGKKEDGLLCEAAERFAVFVSGDLNIALKFGVTVIAVRGGKWMWMENGTVKAAADIPEGKNYTLIKYGDKLRFSGEGQLLFTGVTQDGQSVAPAVLGGVEVLGYIPEPAIAVNYNDLAGQVLQTHNPSPEGLLVKQNFYGATGMPEAETATALITDWCFGYRDQFAADYRDLYSPIGGELAELYPEADGYPYTAVRRGKNQQGMPLESSGFGREYRIGGGHTAVAETAAAVKFPFVPADNICKVNTILGPDNIRTTHVSDGTGEIMTIQGDGDGAAITAYGYDARGLPVKIYYPNYFAGDSGAAGTITYDALGHISSRKEPDGALVNTVYDTDGKLRFIQADSNTGSYVYHVYDSYGRETETGSVNSNWDDAALRQTADTVNTPPDGSVWAKRIYYYDGTDTPRCFENGCIAKVITANGADMVTELYGYDKYGNVTDYSVTVNGHTESVKSEYDLNGRLISRRMGDTPDGVLSYGYDAGGRIKEIKYNGARIYECEFDAGGKLTAESLGKLTRSYQYGAAQNLTKISDRYFTQELSYGGVNPYSGRISEITAWMDGAGDEFTKAYRILAEYDSLGRLAKVNDGSGVTLSYDRGFNLTHGFNGSDWSYQPGTNKLVDAGGKAFDYNSWGGVSNTSAYELGYDAVFERTDRIRTANREVSYIYGADGICARTENGKTDYVVTIGGKAFFTRKSDGTAVILVHGENGVIVQIINGRCYWLLKDYQGSVRAVFDGEGLCEAYRYSVTGEIAEQWMSGADQGLLPIRFIGAYYEGSAGLYRLDARLYDPGTGRFLSPDPKVQFPNPYIYGGADWINYFDPDGAWSWTCFSIVGGIVVAVAGIALTIASAGIAAPALALGAGILSAGIAGAGMASAVYGVSAAISGDFDVKDWGISVGAGFLFGAITAGVGAAVPSGLFTGLGVSSAVSTFLVDAGTGLVIGAADGYVTNGLINVSHSRDFNEGGWQSALIGGAMGGFLGSVGGLASGYRTNMARNLGSRTGNHQIGIVTEIHPGTYNHSVLTRYQNGAFIRGRDIWPSPGSRKAIVGSRPVHGPVNRINNVQQFDAGARESRFRITDRAANRLQLPVRGTDLGAFSVYTNSCTGNVVNWIAAAGICPPVWVRWPNALRFWAWLGSL